MARTLRLIHLPPLPEYPPIRIIHLIWAPLGPAALEGFLRALREHPPGHEAKYTFVLNGFVDRAEAQPWLGQLAPLDCELVWTPEPLQDLAAYRLAVERANEPLACLMNSYARPLREGWLELLAAAVRGHKLAAAGATGSWESHGSELRLRDRLRTGGARDRLGSVFDWAVYQRRFPRFPNPHLRTNGLLYPRALMVEALGRPVRDKPEAFAVESGRRGLSRRLTDEGGELLVVTRDGAAHPPAEWPMTNTFRAGELESLLIADNRTDDWMGASPEERRQLAHRAWGDHDSGS
jgi:hypothetical protein